MLTILTWILVFGPYFLTAHFYLFLTHLGLNCQLQLIYPYRSFFFFFLGTEGPDRMGLTAPSEYGIAKGQLFFFVVARLAFG